MLPEPRNSAAPGRGITGGNAKIQRTGSPLSVGATSHNGTGGALPLIDAATVDEHLGGVLVLLVRTSAGRYRRRVFLSVAAAQRAADRALQAGHAAEVVLCRLEPVGAVL